MPHMSEKAAYWLVVCRAFAPGGDGRFVKQAELGGDGRDGQFEQAFSNLAHAFLKDKAPSLLDYEVGFQLMERNEDNTKAVGVFGFKVGPQWLYAPMFFISGDLKGHELLYIKSQDQFVPLKENWLNYLLQRRPNVLGRDVQPNLQRLGVLGPDLQAFSRPPTKFGAHVKVAGVGLPADLVPGMAAFAHFARTDPLADAKYAGVTDLPAFLKKEGAAVLGALVRQVEAYPRLADAFDAFHGGLGIIDEAVKAATARGRRTRDVLEKEGLQSFEFGRHPAHQRGAAPSIYNGGQASTGYDAFRSLDRVTRRDGSGWTPAEFHKAALTGGGILGTIPPPAPRPAGGMGGVLGGSHAPQAGGPIQFGGGGSPPPGITGGAGTFTPTETEVPPVPQPTRVQRLMSGLQSGFGHANDWLGQHASWIPAGLPGGRATAAMLGIGGLAGVGGMLAAGRRRKSRQELLAEALAKEGEATNWRRRGPKGPFEQLVDADTPSRAKPKGKPPVPGGVLAKMAADDEPDADLRPAAGGDDPSPVAVVTMDTVSQRGVFLGVTADEKEKVKADGFVIRDDRPEASVAYEVQTELKLGNPHATGIYEVLTSPGGFDRCLVVVGPQSGDGKKTFCTVVATSGDKKWLNVHPALVWTRQDEVSADEYRKWFEGLSEVGSLKPSYTAVYMLVGPDGSATVPFEVREAAGGDAAVTSYKVYFRDYADESRPASLPPVETRQPYWGYGMDGDRYTSGGCCGGGEDAIHLTNKAGGKLKAMDGQLYVPGGYRLLTLKADQDKDDDRPRSYVSWRSDPAPIMLGKLVDVERAIYEKTAALKLTHTGSTVTVNGHPMHPDYAVVHLVRDWGLREKQARACLKHARAGRAVNYRVDLLPGLPPDPAASHVSDLRVIDHVMKAAAAAGGPMDPSMFGGSTAPAMPAPPTGMEPTLQGAVSAQYPQSEQLPVYTSPDPSGAAAQMDPRMPPQPDPYAAGAAAQAAQTGQREVFDTAMVGGLLKAVRDDTMVDRYLGDMMKGMDRIGRVLFSFYWHGEEFQERYGKKDMPELEDSLRNAFEQVGDVVFFLKQKTVEPFQDETSNVDLTSTAEV